MATYPSNMPDGLTKKVNKALPRKSRKALEDLLNQNAPELARVPNYQAYLLGVEHSAIRVGLALSNDLANAFMHLSLQEHEVKYSNAAERNNDHRQAGVGEADFSSQAGHVGAGGYVSICKIALHIVTHPAGALKSVYTTVLIQLRLMLVTI